MDSNEFIIIGYSDDITHALDTKRMILQYSNYEGEIHVLQMRPAFGVHMGKGAVAIYFVGQQGSVALFNVFRRN